MSADLTPAELARCRVRLAELPGLPGFDPVGLWVPGGSDPTAYLVLYGGEDSVLLHDTESTSLPWWWGKDSHGAGNDPHITALHASTRDRLARWAAERVGLPVGSSAPALLCDEQERHQWRLLSAPSFLRYGSGIIFDGDAEDGVVGLRDLPSEDHRRLPDGSRWVDAVALVEVARHLGRRP